MAGNIFKSRTVWTLVITALVNGLDMLSPEISEALKQIAGDRAVEIFTLGMTLLAGYFRVKPKAIL